MLYFLVIFTRYDIMLKIKGKGNKKMSEMNYNNILENLKKLLDSLKLFPTEEMKKEIYQNNKRLGKFCGKNNWTIPLTLSGEENQELISILEEENSKKLDKLFIEHLTRNEEENLKVIKMNFRNSEITKRYIKPYNQAFRAYNKQMYLSAVMILIAIFEGIVSYYMFNNKNETCVLNNVNSYLNKKYTDKNLFITYQNKETMKSFIDSLFETVNFENVDNIQPFNRHLIMHGRNLNKIGKKEVLQMFSVLDNLLMLIN